MAKPYNNVIVNQVINNLNQYRFVKKKLYVDLTTSEFFNLINISLGFYSPLNRFCNFKDYLNIVNFNRINKKIKWTIPILLSKKNSKFKFKQNEFYLLKYQKKIVGVIKAESFFKIDKKKHNQKVFKTNSKDHPGVQKMNKLKNNFIGGKVYLLNSHIPKDKYFCEPRKARKYKYFSNATAFSTRNICHLGHEHIHKKVIQNKNKLIICIISSDKNKYEIKHIENTYNILKVKKIYKKVKLIKIFIPSLQAGPNEAFLQAILFQNLGFKKFIVGRDHAGVRNFYKKYEAQKIFVKNKFLKINILKTKEPVRCSYCNLIGFENEKFCKGDKQKCKFVSIDGKFIKQQLDLGNFNLLKNYINSKVVKYIKKNMNVLKN